MKAWLILLALLSGCADQGATSAWIEAAERSNHAADTAVDDGNPNQARAALESFMAVHPPQGVAVADVRMLHQDGFFRLAAIALAQQQPRDALVYADRGLRLGQDVDLFTANLLVVRGQALEALDQKDTAAADYLRALSINEQLLTQELDGALP